MPKLKVKVESALHRYLVGDLIDDGFKESIQAILNEFEGKNLLHQNIGQLTRRMEKENPSEKLKFERIWILLDQVSPRITKDFDQRMRKGPVRKRTWAS
ncbi:MAG: hypothetical protein PVF15_08975 [Candidatus Bathyarchaeota archaeon]|jgi:hypothetical protein